MIFKSHSCIQKRLSANLIFYQSIITIRAITIVIQGANIMKPCIVVVINYSIIDQQGITNVLEQLFCCPSVLLCHDLHSILCNKHFRMRHLDQY